MEYNIPNMSLVSILCTLAIHPPNLGSSGLFYQTPRGMCRVSWEIFIDPKAFKISRLEILERHGKRLWITTWVGLLIFRHTYIHHRQSTFGTCLSLVLEYGSTTTRYNQRHCITYECCRGPFGYIKHFIPLLFLCFCFYSIYSFIA